MQDLCFYSIFPLNEILKASTKAVAFICLEKLTDPYALVEISVLRP